MTAGGWKDDRTEGLKDDGLKEGAVRILGAGGAGSKEKGPASVAKVSLWREIGDL